MRLVDEFYAKDNTEGCIAAALIFLEAKAGRSLRRASLPLEPSPLSGGNTWASTYWGPVTKILQTEKQDVATDEAYGIALIHMVRSFLMVRRSPEIEKRDRAFRAQLSALKSCVNKIHKNFLFMMELQAEPALQRIIMESGCLVPMLKGGTPDLDALYSRASRQRDALVALYLEDAAVRFDTANHEITGEPITQEKQEHASIKLSVLGTRDEELPQAGETVVLDRGYLGSYDLDADHPSGGGSAPGVPGSAGQEPGQHLLAGETGGPGGAH